MALLGIILIAYGFFGGEIKPFWCVIIGLLVLLGS